MNKNNFPPQLNLKCKQTQTKQLIKTECFYNDYIIRILRRVTQKFINIGLVCLYIQQYSIVSQSVEFIAARDNCLNIKLSNNFSFYFIKPLQLYCSVFMYNVYITYLYSHICRLVVFISVFITILLNKFTVTHSLLTPTDICLQRI